MFGRYLLKGIGTTSLSQLLVCVVCLNLFTHPLATLAVIGLNSDILAVEAAVFSVEAIGYWVVLKMSLTNATLLSLIANLLTIAVLIVGLLLGATLVGVH